MEEQQESRSVGEKEGDQPSRNSAQTGPEPMESRIDIVETSPRLTTWIESVEKSKEWIQYQTQWPRIPKVPQLLRGAQDFEKFYEPRVISIGPYHHGKSHLQPVEMIKPQCAQQFLTDSKQDIKALYTKIGSNIEAVRNCYDWSNTEEYDDEALAWMMIRDGCFLLQFIRRTGISDVLRCHEEVFVEQDLFLLENQLPFGVLKLILKETNFNDDSPMEKMIKETNFNDDSPMEKMIKKFVTSVTGRPPEGSTSETNLKEEDEEPSHLVDLLRSALLGKYKKGSRQEVGSQPKQEQEAEERGEKEVEESSGGGDGGSVVGSQPKQEQEAEERGEKEVEESSGGGDGGSVVGSQPKQGNWQSFRHIKELKAAGIYIKPSRGFLTDISFNSYFFYGYLKLPPIIIDDSTKPKFLNIAAYEMCREAPNDYTVTSYICFLDNLIDNADDVKELRSRHILYNFLGSDEDVAQIFNEIGNDLVDPEAYKGVKADIQKHYDKRVNTWIAQALHDYFSTPWTFLAFIVAVLILLFTGAQTYYALPGNSK